MKTLTQWLHAIEQLHPDKIELGLDRISQVAQRLNIHTFDATLITLAGTNGKGTTQACLEQCLYAQGYRVAAYSSPHLLSFNERIRVNTQPISDEALVPLFEAVHAACQDTPLTYFEFITLVAFVYFKQQRLDYILLEVGLGGRLDAVNCVAPDFAVITPIDLDHCDWLGDTRDAIAREKAGILRPGIGCVVSDPHPPRSLLDALEAQHVSASFIGQTYDAVETGETWTFISESLTLTGLPKPNIPLPNAAAALMVLARLGVLEQFSETRLKETLGALHVLGRCMWLKKAPDMLLDVAHNPHSAQYLAAYVAKLAGYTQVHAIFGALADKAIPEIVTPLLPYVTHWYVSPLDTPRSADVETIQAALLTAGAENSSAHPSVPTALEAALALAKPTDLILVYGSFFTVGQALGSQSLQTC